MAAFHAGSASTVAVSKDKSPKHVQSGLAKSNMSYCSEQGAIAPLRLLRKVAEGAEVFGKFPFVCHISVGLHADKGAQGRSPSAPGHRPDADTERGNGYAGTIFWY